MSFENAIGNAALNFDSRDPFPLIPIEKTSYREAQRHAEAVDQWLGLKTREIEEQLKANTQSTHQMWIGLPVKSLLTPYTEFRQILARLDLKENSTIVDFGAGYGRM